MSQLPSYIFSPPTVKNVVEPPVQTRIQELPFEQLTWRAFEQLCARLILCESQVEDARPYGVQGDEQGGIDIFARVRNSEKYITYQCKNVSDYGPAKIRDAVNTFRAYNWLAKSSEFVLCTRESLESAARTKAVEEQRQILSADDIQFTIWDSHRLNQKLKDLPEIVDDFFGRAWVNAFCGEERATELTRRRPLDRIKVGELRTRLRKFYENVFRLDSQLPASQSLILGALPSADGYIYPDIEESVSISIIAEPQVPTDFYDDGSIHQNAYADKSSPSLSRLMRTRRETYQARRNFENWLCSRQRSVVLGDPGSGKSSLARFVVTDLLRDEPQLSTLAEHWGQYLPIWVPFALWTRKLADNNTTDCSLSQLIESWLAGYDERYLWPLVQEALEDKRLLLIVDGLDEWSDEKAARQALRKLQIFIEQRQIPVLLTSRPYGFERLQMSVEGWQVGRLCDFSSLQQKQLARVWFMRFVAREFEDLDDASQMQRAEALTDRFTAEIQQSPDLRELAKVPLLLCLLIAFRLQNKHLPADRFKAYRDTVGYMIETHPQRRREAAALQGESHSLDGQDLRAIFSNLAFRVQSEQSQGIVEIATAEQIIEEFLKDEERLGLEPREAHRISRRLLDIGDQSTGLVTLKSPQHIGFFHRIFQEYLAAEHLNSLPEEEQLNILEQRSQDPQWHETILSLFSLTTAPDKIHRLIERLQQVAQTQHIAEYRISELLSEVAFGQFGCPAKVAHSIANEVYKRIEYDSYMPHRARLLEHMLLGLRSSRLKESVQQKVQTWFPHRPGLSRGLYEILGQWRHQTDVEECLWRALHNGDVYQRRAAALALAEIGKDNLQISNRMADLSLYSVDAEIRAAALEALLKGWPQHALVSRAVDEACASVIPSLQLFGCVGKIQQGRQTDEDRVMLLDLSGEWSDLSSRLWDDIVSNALIKGWPGSKELRRECFSRLGRLFHHKKIKRRDGTETDSLSHDPYLTQILVRVLLKGYPKDESVARFSAFQIKHRWQQIVSKNYEKRNLFHDLHGTQFEMLRENFSEHPLIAQAIDEWLAKDIPLSLHERHDSILYARTAYGKELLMQKVDHMPHHSWPNLDAQTLLDGWGLEDAEVKASLEAIVWGEVSKAASIAHLLPRIIHDPTVCRARLLELLKAEECEHPHLVLAGLNELGSEHNDKEVADIIFRYSLEFLAKDARYELALPFIILRYTFDTRTRQLALLLLKHADGPFAAIAKAYEDDVPIRQRILSLAAPLSTDLRQIIATRLRNGSGDESFDLKLLQRYDYDTDGATSTIASCGYHDRIKHNYDEAVLNTLVAGLDARMPYAHQRQMGAFAGLLMLKRADVMERSRHQRLSGLFFQRNTPFVRLLLENWTHIETALGCTPAQIMSYGDEKQNLYHQGEFWEIAQSFVDEYSDAREALMCYLRAAPLLRSDSLLRFLARTEEKQLLLRHCLRELYTGVPYVAAELIGTHFGGNDNVLQQVLGDDWSEVYPVGWKDNTARTHLRYVITVGQIAALCEGWTESEELAFILETAQREKWQIPWPLKFIIICRKSGYSQNRTLHIYHILRRYLRIVPLQGQYRRERESKLISRALHLPLKTDESLAELMLRRLKKTKSPTEKATFAKLLQYSPSSSLSIEWIGEELDRQSEQEFTPEYGYDLTSGQIRPVMHTLLDALL